MYQLYTFKQATADSTRGLTESRRRRFAARQRAYEERCRINGTSPLRYTDIRLICMFLTWLARPKADENYLRVLRASSSFICGKIFLASLCRPRIHCMKR
jgi:hypothetical protein